MPEQNEPWTALLLKGIETVLSEGSVAALATLASGDQNVGSKILVPESGPVIGSLGNSDLDKVVVERARQFLSDRDEAHLFQAGDFAPQVSEWRSEEHT